MKQKPETSIKLATSFPLIGARDLSFLSCRAYPKHGITAVIRFADALYTTTTTILELIEPKLK